MNVKKLMFTRPQIILVFFIITLVVILLQFLFQFLMLSYLVGIGVGWAGVVIAFTQWMTKSKPKWKDYLCIAIHNFTLLYWVGFLIGLIATLFQQF